MTREQQRQVKQQKQEAKLAAKLQKKQDRLDERGWNKMVAMAKSKGAWIED